MFYIIKGKSGDIKFELDGEEILVCEEILSLKKTKIQIDWDIVMYIANCIKDSDINFVDYIDKPLQDALDSGYMFFKAEGKNLITITMYKAKRKLTEKEQKELMDYTQGQWAYGIGARYKQSPCYNFKDDFNENLTVFISPWYIGQTLTIKEIL